MTAEIIQKIDHSILYWLKLHTANAENLTIHVSNDLDDAVITLDGINSRLDVLYEEIKVSKIQSGRKLRWQIVGEPTLTSKIWKVVSTLAKAECHIDNITYTLTKQNLKITPLEISNAVGILQTNEIIYLKNKTVILTNLEKSFIQRRMNL